MQQDLDRESYLSPTARFFRLKEGKSLLLDFSGEFTFEDFEEGEEI